MVQERIMQFSQYSQIPLVFRDGFIQRFWRVQPEWRRQRSNKGMVGKTSHF